MADKENFKKNYLNVTILKSSDDFSVYLKPFFQLQLKLTVDSWSEMTGRWGIQPCALSGIL